jgi:hypothetical protein
MPNIRILKSMLLLSAGFCCSNLMAGDVSVTWQNPENFTDIESDDLDAKTFQSELFEALETEFRKQAQNLPAGSTLTVTVSDFNMAGERRVGRDGDFRRIVNDTYSPGMRLDYVLTDSGGAELSRQAGMTYRNMGFLDANSMIRADLSPKSFYHETALIQKWFDDTLDVKK